MSNPVLSYIEDELKTQYDMNGYFEISRDQIMFLSEELSDWEPISISELLNMLKLAKFIGNNPDLSVLIKLKKE